MNLNSILAILIALVFVTGCSDTQAPQVDQSEDSPADRSSQVVESKLAPDRKDREADLVRSILGEHDPLAGDRIYFLTPTPRDEWGDKGDWSDFSESFHDSIATLNVKYRFAHDAYLKDGSVLEKGTNTRAWMRWIVIRRWISDTEMEVEDGVWCCSLGGGGSTATYEMRDGRWHLKSLGISWVS